MLFLCQSYPSTYAFNNRDRYRHESEDTYMNTSKKPLIVGSIAGMGAEAGILLQQLVVEATRARRDQDHIPFINYTNPAIPDRSSALLSGKTTVVENRIVQTGRALIRAGATVLVMPCHTAHLLYEKIAHRLPMPLLDMVGLTLGFAQKDHPIGLLATDATVSLRLYQEHLQAEGLDWVLPEDLEQRILMNTIYEIKAGSKHNAGQTIDKLVTKLVDRGAQGVILGCTELSLVTEYFGVSNTSRYIDPLRIMAAKIVEMHRQSKYGKHR